MALDQISSHHAVSGNSLAEESSDVVWTERGAYFGGSSLITLPSNSVVKESLLIPKDFIIEVWVFPENSGQIYSKFDPSNSGEDLISFYTTSTTFEAKYLSGTPDFSPIPLSRWSNLKMIVNSRELRASTNGADATSQTYTEDWSDSKNNLSRLGMNGNGSNGLQGFIYKATIYDDPDNDSGTVVNSSPTCITCAGICPQETDQCIPDCEDPLKTSDCNQDCNCGDKGCHSNDPDSCISCHPECNGICTQNMDSTSCTDPQTQYCSPYEYDSTSQSCNFEPICVDNCDLCYNTLECQDCSPGYYLTPSKLCSEACPTGYYPNGEVCEKCHSNCSECTGPSNSDCNACADSKRTPVSGICECSEGYFENSGVCEECHFSCKRCTSSSKSDCTTCKDSSAQLLEGECLCREGFQMNESGECETTCEEGFQVNEFGECESSCGKLEFYEKSNKSCVACHFDCGACTGNSKYDCKECKDTNAQLNQENFCECQESYYAESTNPLVCSKCPQNCKNCTSEECLECLSGYQINEGRCSNETQKFFEVTAKLENNNKVKVTFSENLLNHLEEAQVDVELKEQTSVIVYYNLTQVSLAEYFLNLNYSKTVEESDSIILNFDSKLQSQSGASLLNDEIELELQSSSSETGFKRKAFWWAFAAIALVVLALKNAKGYFWVFLNTAQLVSLFALVTQEIPSELYEFFMFFAPDFIPNVGEWIYSDNSKPNPYRWNNYGFTSSLFLLSAGHMLFCALVFTGLFVCIFIVSVLFRTTSYRWSIQKKLKKFSWSHSIRFWLEVYVFVAAAALISLQQIPLLGSADFAGILNFCLGALFALLTLATPLGLALLLHQNKQRIFSSDQSFNRSIRTLLEEFREEPGVSGLMYHPLFCLRRLVLVVGLFYLEGVLQAATGAVLSLGMLAYLLKCLPFEGKLLNALNVIGELLILLVWVVFLISAADIPSGTIEALSWVVILSVSVFLGVCYLFFMICSLFFKTPKTSRVQPQIVVSTDSYSKPGISPSSEQLFTPVPLAYEFDTPKVYRDNSPLSLRPAEEEKHP